jgi:hypothetical protein
MFWLKLLAVAAFFCSCVIGALCWLARNILPGNGEWKPENGRHLHYHKSQPHPWRRKTDRRRK